MTIRLLTGDCRAVLPTLPDASVQCVVTSPPYYALRSYLDAEHPDKHREMGSEPTPDAYIAAMVGAFREVRRILRDDGVMFLNVGDSYSSGARTTQCDPSEAILGKVTARPDAANGGARRAPAGIAKPKDLLLMPARLALELQADGWWVRSDIIWAKPNPMPESCTDRPTSAHEHIFLLTKRARYFYDADAVREMHTAPERQGQTNTGWCARHADDVDAVAPYRKEHVLQYNPAGRNLRNVWNIATHPYIHAHFATVPPELAERCIRAGTSERGCCSACGAPLVRVTERGETFGRTQNDGAGYVLSKPDGGDIYGRNFMPNRSHISTTTGWSASCQCGAETRPCVVLDCFSGAGTTALVADRLGRDAIGIDLSHAYVEMTRERLRADSPLFMDIGPSPPPAEDPEDARMADLFQDMAAD
jgi:DNA modification methylase